MSHSDPLGCRLLREGRLDELAVCIIDELHMIRDAARGAALETSITKLLFSPLGRNIQACLVKPSLDVCYPKSFKPCLPCRHSSIAPHFARMHPLSPDVVGRVPRLRKDYVQPLCRTSDLCRLTLPQSWLGMCYAQIIGMSATMAGLDAMGEWLKARLFLTNFRPVPLTEHAVFSGTVFRKVGSIQEGGLQNYLWHFSGKSQQRAAR